MYPCEWTQCINPPLPSGRGLVIRDPDQMTDPIDFYDTVKYVCESAALYFDFDRDADTFEIQCFPDGSFDLPLVWPKCIESRETMFFFH